MDRFMRLATIWGFLTSGLIKKKTTSTKIPKPIQRRAINMKERFERFCLFREAMVWGDGSGSVAISAPPEYSSSTFR